MSSNDQKPSVPQTGAIPIYPFLSQPPPQKKRPTHPPPAPPAADSLHFPPRESHGRRDSSIAAWVANVHPGSPAPHSPCPSRRSPSTLSRRSSVSRLINSRRPSFGSLHMPPTSFLDMHDTPTTASRPIITPAVKEFTPEDLAMIPTASLLPPSVQSPKSKTPRRGLKHFASLAALRSTRRATSSLTKPCSPAEKRRIRAAKYAASVKKKRSTYEKFGPPQAHVEVGISEFLGEGGIDEGITGITFYLDGEGRIYRDEEEVWEYAHLLGWDDDFCEEEVPWDKFGFTNTAGDERVDERRGSISSQDSDLQQEFAMQTDDDQDDNLVTFGGATPSPECKPGMSVLALPARSHRQAMHLHKPEFLLDVFSAPGSQSFLVKSPHTLGPHKSSIVRDTAEPRQMRMKRRPSPLKLLPPSPAKKRPTNPADLEDIRRDFLEESFAPTVHLTSCSSAAVAARAVPMDVVLVSREVRKASTLKGFFKVLGSKKA